MILSQDDTKLEMWVDRTRRMVGYWDEALDFLNRAGGQIPVLESDIGLVCRLWAIADEYDEIVCRALSAFDNALSDDAGELDITRGVETSPSSDEGSRVLFHCTWSVVRTEQESVSCILYGEQMTGAVGLELRDSQGVGQAIPFPLVNPSDLYEAMSDNFFGLAARL